MNIGKKQCLILFLSVVCSLNMYGQYHTAYAALDSNNMLIGDQLQLKLTFSSQDSTPILFPFYCDTCIPGVEIIKRSAVDTLVNENGRQLSQQWTITAFDSGIYRIPSMFFYGKDSQVRAETEPLLLTVHTIAVDTTLAIKDIKGPLSAPITLREILPYILIAVLLFGVIGGSIFLIRYLRTRKKPKPLWKEKPALPAHVIALRSLDQLWQKKLCQSGQVKQHYSELSDIIRVYIENRWSIAAMEMVSSEILTALAPLSLSAEALEKLEQALYVSDMVKFAKVNPLPDENSASYQSIVDFVHKTKQEKESIEATEK